MCETDPDILVADTWNHIAVVSDQEEFRIYADSSLVEKSDYQETEGGNEIHYLGDTPFSAGQFYSGVIDEIAIFTRPLTQVEIKSIMDSGIEIFAVVEPGGKLTTKWGDLKLGE